MKNLLRLTTAIVALAFGGVAQADVLTITEDPDVFLTNDLPSTSLIRIFYENEGSSSVNVDAVQFRVRFSDVLDADTNNDGNADGFAALPGFVLSNANAAPDPSDPPGTSSVLIGAFGTGSSPTVAAGAVVELFRFNLFVSGSTPPSIYPLTLDFIELVLNGVPTSPAIENGAIVVNFVPEPASMAMVGMAGLLGLSVVARRRLARKAD